MGLLFVYVKITEKCIAFCVLRQKLIFRQLRGVLDHFNHLQINLKFTYLKDSQLSDVSDVLGQF